MKTCILALLMLQSVAFAAPAASPPASKPMATCRDGKTMYSSTGEKRGACSGHGGVSAWADGSPVHAKGGKATSYK